MRNIVTSLFGVAWLLSCAPNDAVIGTDPAGAETNDFTAQGTKLQGTKLQGTKLQGTKLQGTKLQGITLQGTQLTAVWLDGAVLKGLGPKEKGVSGMDFAGARLQGIDAAGQPVELAFGDIIRDPEDPDREILLYTLLYRDGIGDWQNACEADADGVRRAIPLSGLWDDRGEHQASDVQITLACTSGVLAKCARWGYRPWRITNGTSLAPFHQSCTRMARGDYCGGGVPHTRDGTLIDIYDRLGIMTRTAGTGMIFEAAWTPDGAYCVSKARWNVIAAQLLLECPQKLSLPTPEDVLNQDSCAMRLSASPRSASPMSNASFIQVAL